MVPNTQLKHILSLWQTLSAKRSVLLVQMNQVRETAQFTKLSTRARGRNFLRKLIFCGKLWNFLGKKIGKFCDFNILPFSKSQAILIYLSHIRPLEKGHPQDFVLEAVVLSGMGHTSSWCCGLWWAWHNSQKQRGSQFYLFYQM